MLCIPNEEVQQEFRDLTASYLNVSESNLSAMFNGLRYEERERFAQSYADMLQSLPSYHDLKDENSYHVLFLGMCAWLSNEYEIKSNREAREREMRHHPEGEEGEAALLWCWSSST